MSLIVLVFLSLFANAFTVPGDDEYFIYKNSDTSIIFAEEHKNFIPSLVEFNEHLNNIIQDTYNWKIDNHAHYVLTSSKNQIANAFASVSPHVLSTYYHSGAPMLENFAESNWLLHTWTHELSHMYQLNSKSNLSSLLYKFLGTPPSFYGIMIHPNQLAPRHFTEGNAVLVESLFNSGGRLHSGEIRAEVFSLFLANKVDTAWLLNNLYEFPFGAEDYHVGGYFQMFLAEKYGLEQTNSYFLSQAQKWYWPFIINDTYKNHFYKSYYELFEEFKKQTFKLASKQKLVPFEQSLAHSKAPLALNRSQGKVYTLASDLQQKPKLLTYNIKNNSLDSQPTKLSFNSRGKVFNINNKWYTQASGTIETDDGIQLVQGLYDSSMNLKSDSFGEYVLDIKKDQKLSFDIKASMLEPKLYLNNKFYDVAHSKALFDDNGDIYYFKQQDQLRTLYKNKKPVFSFNGYYSKLADIMDNTVFFIANTKYGSSLFKYENNKIIRVSEFDNIVDAKLISKNKALVASVHSEGYYLVSLQLSSIQEDLPVVYNYNVDSIKVDLKLKKTTESIRTKKYSAFKNLKFNYFLPTIANIETVSSTGKSKTHTVYSLDFGFSDPLGWNQLQLFYFRDTFEDDSFNFIYEYSRYRLQFGLGYDYSKLNVANSDNQVIGTINKNIFDIYFRYPYYISPRWQHLAKLTHSINSSKNKSDYTTALLNGAYAYSTGKLSLQPYSFFNYQLGYRYYEDQDQLYRADLGFSQNIGYEFYSSLNFNYAKATSNRLSFFNSQLEMLEVEEVQSYSLTDGNLYSEIFKANFEIKKGLITEVYTNKIPLGLTRLSPLAGASYFSFSHYGYLSEKEKLQPYTRMTETYYGLELELLFAHAFPLKVQLIQATNNVVNTAGSLFLRASSSYNF